MLVVFSAGFPLDAERMSELTATIDACNKANVAIYSLDVRGLLSTAPAEVPSVNWTHCTGVINTALSVALSPDLSWLVTRCPLRLLTRRNLVVAVAHPEVAEEVGPEVAVVLRAVALAAQVVERAVVKEAPVALAVVHLAEVEEAGLPVALLPEGKVEPREALQGVRPTPATTGTTTTTP